MYNKSKQRDAVLEVLKSTKSHPTAEWVHEEAKKIIPNISLATVYRNLNQLIESGEVIKVQGVFEKDRFDADSSRHAHLVCRRCGGVIDFVIDKDIDKLLMERDNECELVDFSLTYYGLCPYCNKNSKEI